MSLKTRWLPSKIFVEKSVVKDDATREILNGFSGPVVEFTDKPGAGPAGDRASELIIARRRGSFIKKCPGTPGYQCCDYYVLNLGVGCFFNCSYCFLHHYMNSPFVLYVNFSDLIDEVGDFCRHRPDRVFRIGSGEFIDSLGIDDLSGVNRRLIPALSRIPNLLFEIKTKSDRVDHLLNLEHRGRVVISWSVNSGAVIRSEEPQTASLEERLEAAVKSQQDGYQVGFHFDPLIHYPGWERDYREVVDLIFSRVEPSGIAWISLGALRFNPALKQKIERRFPESRLVYGELVPGLDGKLRYFLPIRRKMFARLVEYIKSYDSDAPVYLCMENRLLAEAVGARPVGKIMSPSI